MRLKVATSPDWAAAVLRDLDAFLLDHAACERKASSSAMALVAHYPDRPELVAACIELAREELEHFQRVATCIAERGLVLAPDRKDAYMGAMARAFRKGGEAYFLDRLVTAAVAEARGCERFGLVAAALPPGPLRDLYRDLARSEVRHHELYLSLARRYFGEDTVSSRLEEVLALEATVIAELPVRAALYG